MKFLQAPDALIFDIDGVLLDVRRSFPEVIRQAVKTGWVELYGGDADCDVYGPEHERVMKRHGGFNDDFDLSWSLLCISAASGRKKLSQAFPSPEKLAKEVSDCAGNVPEWAEKKYHAGISRAAIHELCHRLYGYGGSGGLHMLETPMLRTRWDKLPLPVGIYTGRNLIEWEFAKQCLGWEDFPLDRVIHSETGITKPSPAGLEILCRKFGAKNPLFFGDTASDYQAWKAFGAGAFVAIGELLPEAEFIFEDTQTAVDTLLELKEPD